MLKKIAGSIVLSVLFSTAAFAVGNTSSEKKQAKMTLQDCIEMALKQNLELNIESYSPKLQLLNLQKIKDDFGISVGFEPQIRNEVKPTSNSFISGGSILNQFFQNYNFYAKKKLATGGEFSLRFDNSIFNTNSTRVDLNPAINPHLSFNFNHPLLKYAFNGQKRISIGENETESSSYKLKGKAIEIVSRTQDSYWNLILTKERLKVLENSLELTKDLLKINKEKEKAGFMAKIDILATEANIAAKEENILQVQKNLGDNEDSLKKLINSGNSTISDWKTEILPLDKPEFNKFNPDFDASLKKAMERPDFRIMMLDTKNLELEKQINSQNRLPNLNFEGNAGLEGLDSKYTTAISRLFDFKTYFWNIGLNFEIPVTGNKAETEYQEVLIKEEKQKLVVNELKQKIFTEVRNSIRSVEINERRVQANKLAKKLAEEQIKAEIEKLNLGLSTNFQVLQYQKDFEEASLNEVNAIIDYIKSVNNLSEVEGTLLENNNIVWELKGAK